ncbi:MAG: DUF2059 domain-containing protein [Xanthomonadaceae bacterium]|nr:DUF2059 domain-containing protein [Xanthomonadaceae bacterium]
MPSITSLFLRSLLLMLAVTTAGTVAAEPASDAEIERLLEVTRVRDTLENMTPQIEVLQQQVLEQMIGDREIGPREQEMLDSIVSSSRRFTSTALSWEQMRPLYVQIYRDTFDREDILGLIEFYETPLGHRLLERQPLLMQNVMRAMQEKMMPMLQELEREMERTLWTVPGKDEARNKQ